MKVLIISHNPISTYQNMGKTMLALFNSFKEEELCQLYVYPTFPDIKKCHSYFRITDKDVLRSYFRFFKVQGKEVDADLVSPKNGFFENVADESLYRNQRNKLPLTMICRDLMWACSRWNNIGLKEWIEKEAPTHIFVAPGSAKFIYRIALNLSKKYKLPIVTYICDDYFFLASKGTFLTRFQRNSLKKAISKLLNNSAHIIYICEPLRKAYQKVFTIQSSVIMTGVNKVKECTNPKSKINSITYMGGIRHNRWESLVDIGVTLDTINCNRLSDYTLNIYTDENNPEILGHFDGIKSIKLCGFVTGEEYNRVMHESPAFLHIESFDNGSIDAVKYSISTKIADSLASGKILFAYGPDCVASISYLLDNECAIVATESGLLKEKLLELFENIELTHSIVKRAVEVANSNHDVLLNGNTVKNIFYSI